MTGQLADALNQGLKIEGLAHITIATRLFGQCPVLAPGSRGHHDHRQVPEATRLANFPQGLDTVLHRHFHIQQHHIGQAMSTVEQIDGHHAVFRGHGLHTYSVQLTGRHHPLGARVINHQCQQASFFRPFYRDSGDATGIHTADQQVEVQGNDSVTVCRGGGAREAGLSRLFLHAHRLRLRHPVGGSRVRVEAPLPVSLAQVLGALGLSEGFAQSPAGRDAGARR